VTPSFKGNVRVKNDNVNLFRYFAATAQAVFLYTCVQETIEHALPDKVVYLQVYGRFSQVTQAILAMPNQKIDSLRHFLKRAIGHLSKHARMKEFAILTDAKTTRIEGLYSDSFSKLADAQAVVSTFRATHDERRNLHHRERVCVGALNAPPSHRTR